MKKLILTTLLATTILLANSGEELTKQNGCMECHNIMGKKAAPAFMGTAKKNLKWYGDEAKANIIKGIKNGSKGKYRQFANTEMPAYSNMPDSDLETIASWILSEFQKMKSQKMNQGQKMDGQGKGRP